MNTPIDRIAIGTISTANYWPYTAVLLESIARVGPDWQVFVLALNDLPKVDLPSNVTILSAHDLWGADADLCKYRFNLFEWACASKAKLLRFMLDHGHGALAAYVDSDIEFFSPPASFFNSNASILLTPNVASLNECASMPWERLHLQYGAYNGGFLAVRDTAAARSFLAWWDERITRYCCTEPLLDIFSDQRWLDLVPSLFPSVHIDRSPDLNVATWNVRARELRLTEGRYWVGDQELTFFHYHRVRLGMDTEAYLAELDHHSAARALVHDYLKKAALHAPQPSAVTGRHDQQVDGTLIPPIVYRAVRDTIAEDSNTLKPGQSQAQAPERLRLLSLARGRLRARLRVLSYHWGHAAKVVAPESDVARYMHSFLFRLWIDAWYFIHAPKSTQLPLNWVTTLEWARRGRSGLSRAIRLLLRR